jgi:hypothetical protein
MKRTLSSILALALLSAPALPALAVETPAPATVTAEALVTAEPSPVAAAPKDLSATAEPAKPEAAPAPELPADKGSESPAVPEYVTPTGELELPKAPAAKPEEPESAYKLKNFALGFLGGAVVGGAVGVLFFSQGDKGTFDPEKAKIMGPAIAAAGGLAFGLAALLLGTTTPVEVKPPKVETEGGLRISVPAQPLAGLNVRYDWSF